MPELNAPSPAAQRPAPAATYSDWTILNEAGKAVWIVTATSAEHAMTRYTGGVSARPYNEATDSKLAQYVTGSYGRSY